MISKIFKIPALILIFSIFIFSFSPVFADAVKINEIIAHPSSGPDWIELFNPNSNVVDVGNWTLSDSTSVIKTLTGTVPGYGYTVFEVSTRLNNDGDTITLKDEKQNEIDKVNYDQDPGLDISLGRSPDGETWGVLATTSKGGQNGSLLAPTSTPTPSPTPTSTPANTPTPTKSPTFTPTPKPTTLTPTPTTASTLTSTPSSSAKKSAVEETDDAKIPENLLAENQEVQGESTSISPTPLVEGEQATNNNLIIKIIIGILVLGTLGGIANWQKDKLHIPHF